MYSTCTSRINNVLEDHTSTVYSTIHTADLLSSSFLPNFLDHTWPDSELLTPHDPFSFTTPRKGLPLWRSFSYLHPGGEHSTPPGSHTHDQPPFDFDSFKGNLGIGPRPKVSGPYGAGLKLKVRRALGPKHKGEGHRGVRKKCVGKIDTTMTPVPNSSGQQIRRSHVVSS